MLSIMWAIIYKLCVQAGKWTAWACESDDRACKAERSWEMNVDAREMDSVCVTEEKRWRMENRKWESCSSSCCGNKFTMIQMFGYIQNPFLQGLRLWQQEKRQIKSALCFYYQWDLNSLIDVNLLQLFLILIQESFMLPEKLDLSHG